MKICLVPTMFPKYIGDYYGSFVFDEARMLVKKGIEVHVITQHNPNIPYEEIMEGIHVHRFKWLEPKEFKALVHFKGLIDNFRLITYMISLFFNLISTIMKHDINIIHAHSVIPTGLIGVIVAKICRKPVFITSHGMDINNFEESSFFTLLIKFSLKYCNIVIPVSEDLAGKIKSLGINQDKLTVLRNSVDINRFKPSKNKEIRKNYNIDVNKVLILFVGYLDLFKGIFELINAFSEVNKKNKNAILMIVGEGPKKSELKNRISKLNLKKSVIFTGKIDPSDMQKYYQAADIFVLPSYTEGLPLALIEAIACGLPAIVSNVGGMPEVIKEHENGFLVSPKNVNEIYDRLNILINNNDLRKDFSKKSIKRVNENTLNINNKINSLIKLYNEWVT